MNINTNTLIMKLFINTLTITLIFLTSFSALASKNFEVEVKSDQILNIKISHNNATSQLYLKDSNFEVLFMEKSILKPYVKNISLRNLPNGTYSLSLEDDNLITTKSISKTKSGIEISDSAVAFKPHFKQLESDASKVKIAFVNTSKMPAQFKVFDKNGNLIIEIENSDAVFNKTLDFSEVPSGAYSIAVNSKGRSFYKNVMIK